MGNIKIYAEVLEDEALEQFNNAMSLECNVQGALMPDAHTGYTLPIGAVIKSKGVVFPSYVGYDIGCGMCAVKLDIPKDGINLEELKNNILQEIPIGFNKHKTKQDIFLHDEDYNINDFTKHRIDDTGVYQIGTLGGGNHFIEIGESVNDSNLWIVIHSGSRGLGYKVAEYFMNIAAQSSININELEKDFIVGREVFKEKNPQGYDKALEKFIESNRVATAKNKEGHYGLSIFSEFGKSYINCMNYCLDFALENRKVMIDKIINSIKKQKDCNVITFINRNHNHADIKDGFVIHRKGATHAEKDMMGVIPANMKDGSFIVKGKGNKDSMCSSSHGAGRVLSRKKAKETLDLKEFHKTMEYISTNHTDDTLDESPKAYKNIFEVMELQKDLVDIVDRSIPILNIKG